MGWYGVDFDGTLAVYPTPGGLNELGAPIAPMVDRVLDWLNAGQEVRIFTARAATPELVPPIIEWCRTHLGRELKVTNVKDFAMIALYDDRAVQVVYNQGHLVGCRDCNPHHEEA